MKKEWLLFTGVMLVTLLVALGGIRLFAPHLIGVTTPIDLQVVQVSKEVPFYELLAAAHTDADPDQTLLNDPIVGHRRRGMVTENNLRRANFNAPFDILGFRNRNVPVYADVVTLGDSLTIGINATVDTNWPGFLGRMMREKRPIVYSMANEGWGSFQHLAVLKNALVFQPRVIVVALSTGGEPRKAVRMAYTMEPWKDYRESDVMPESAPSYWPSKLSDAWQVNLNGGLHLRFTPKMRLAANDRRYSGVLEGYRMMVKAATEIARQAAVAGVPVVFTIIPNKELVYAARVRQEGLTPPEAYTRLIRDERQNLEQLATNLGALPNATYVDVLAPLQQVAMGQVPLYPPVMDGHPLPLGYQVIAQALLPVVSQKIPAPPKEGMVMLGGGTDTLQGPALVRQGYLWHFGSEQAMWDNGWKNVDVDTLPRLTERDIAVLHSGWVLEANPARFGPKAGGVSGR